MTSEFSTCLTQQTLKTSESYNVDTITYTTLIGQAKCEGKTGFVAYANSHIEKLQNEGRYDAAIKLKGYIKRFVTFLGKKEIPFKEFDDLVIRNYHTQLENKTWERIPSLYIRNLKRIYRLAVNDGIASERNPFDGMDVSYRIKKREKWIVRK